jgi:hypothetical protein
MPENKGMGKEWMLSEPASSLCPDGLSLSNVSDALVIQHPANQVAASLFRGVTVAGENKEELKHFQE